MLEPMASYVIAVGPRVQGAFTFPSDVDRLKQDVSREAAALDRAVVPCMAKLDAATLEQWHDMLDRVNKYVQAPTTTFGSGSAVDAGQAIQRDLQPWYGRLKAAGCSDLPDAPAPPPSSTPIFDVLKSPALLILAGWLLLREFQR
jgi:hypothetical protein